MDNIIAQRSGQYLVDVGDGMGKIIDTEQNTTSSPINMLSLLVRGYWEPYQKLKDETIQKYDPSEPRDSHGRWTTDGDTSVEPTPKAKYGFEHFTTELLSSMVEKAYPGGTKPDLSRESIAQGNKFLCQVLKEQGYLEKPTMLSPEEFDKYVSDSKSEIICRGVGTTSPIIDENGVLNVQKWYDNYIQSDEPRIGLGIAGDGQYFSINKDDAHVYSNGGIAYPDNDSKYGRIYESCLKPDSNVISFSDLRDRIEKDESYENGEIRSPIRDLLQSAAPQQNGLGYTNMLATWAVMNGYDAIKNKDVFSVLNRGALIIKDNGGKINE